MSNAIDKRTMLKYQGDKVLVIVDKEQTIFTIVRIVGETEELCLVNRTEKNSEPLPLSQAILDSLEPIKHREAKWKLEL